LATVTCPQCGHENPLGAHFCSSCGVDLEGGEGENGTTMSVLVPIDSPEEEVQVDLDELPPGVGMLVVTRGHNSGSRFALDEAVVTAGRHPDSTIFLDDITVSRRHAEIRRIPEGYQLADVGSLNGTYLNRERVEACTLQDGDELQIGTFKLLFLAGRS
jgi:pSer/pThr/pTyr-binding forkhead associated (FHA) protein